MRNVIGILSGKGGVGKTTVAVNLGLAMHKLGEEVVLVDGNLKNPNLGMHLDALECDMTLHDVLEEDISMLDAIHIHKSGLRFIPAHLSLSYLNMNLSNMKGIFNEFNHKVLIDSPPGLERGAFSILEVCDEILVVTTPYLPDVTDCLKIIEIARNMDIKIRGIVLNKVRKRGYEIDQKEIEACSNTQVIVPIPWDDNILKSLAYKIPLVEFDPLSQASISFFQLASKLSGKKYKPPRFLRIRRIFFNLVNSKY